MSTRSRILLIFSNGSLVGYRASTLREWDRTNKIRKILLQMRKMKMLTLWIQKMNLVMMGKVKMKNKHENWI
jgi:hypothetical protein